jgi:hypothetical protein
MNASKFLSINQMDAIKSTITAAIGIIISTVGTSVYAIVDKGRFPTLIELKVALGAGLLAGVASVTRRFFTPAISKTTIVKPFNDGINE